MNDRDAILERIDRLHTDMNKRLDKQDGALFGDPSDPAKPGLMTRVDRIEQTAVATNAGSDRRRTWLMALTGSSLAMAGIELWNFFRGK